MIIGIPKELKSDENRVAITPAGARELIELGSSVIVERSAGLGSASSDEDYLKAGASIASVEDVWGSAEIILKVKEPLPEEVNLLREGQVLFTYLHLAANRELTESLLASGAVCLAYETVQLQSGVLPLLAPMSEVAGRLSVQVGAWALEKPQGGRGVLLGGVPGVPPANVVVIGGGTAGSNAALIALGMKANVLVLEQSVSRMRELDVLLDGRATLAFSNSQQVEEALAEADLIIGAVLIPGAKAPVLVSREMIGVMNRGSVIVDIAIDQGGCFETSRPTAHSDPVYEVDDVVHYCVTNMPGAVPVTSTKALVNVTLPYVKSIVRDGLRKAVCTKPDLALGVNIADGLVTNNAVGTAHGLDAHSPTEVISG